VAYVCDQQQPMTHAAADSKAAGCRMMAATQQLLRVCLDFEFVDARLGAKNTSNDRHVRYTTLESVTNMHTG
jgi:hypothetical protein